jgi:ribosomal protein L11
MFNKEEKNLVRFFNLRINAKDASFENINVGPNLSPYINKEKITQFCSEFNKVTDIYVSKEIPIYIRLFLYTDNSLFFIVRGPSFSFILKLLFGLVSLKKEFFDKDNKQNIKLKELYDIILFKNYFFNKLIKRNSFIIKNQIRNSFFSMPFLKVSTDE